MEDAILFFFAGEGSVTVFLFFSIKFIIDRANKRLTYNGINQTEIEPGRSPFR